MKVLSYHVSTISEAGEREWDTWSFWPEVIHTFSHFIGQSRKDTLNFQWNGEMYPSVGMEGEPEYFWGIQMIAQKLIWVKRPYC